MPESRSAIIRAYARWTALSALRSGSPVKSRADIYRLLDGVAFDTVLIGHGALSGVAFAEWHEHETMSLCARNARLGLGWAVKLVNVYLKTAAYVGDLGRPGIRECLHPPLDAGLWSGIERRFVGRRDILAHTHAASMIKDLRTYPVYAGVIAGCRKIAAELGCRLIEVEQLWTGADTPVT